MDWQANGQKGVKPELRVLTPTARPDMPASFYPATGTDGGTAFLCAHRGNSMNPTLGAQDFLEITPYADRPIRVGDVIAFAPPTGEQLVAHRVTAVTAHGIRTRGDNNGAPDASLLQPEHILGQVTGAWHGSRHRHVPGGLRGRRIAWWGRQRKRFIRRLSLLLHPIYEGLARTGLIRWLWPQRLAPRVVTFEVAGQSVPRLLVGHRTIGWYDRTRQRWQIRRPYRLFVDTAALSKRLEDGCASARHGAHKHPETECQPRLRNGHSNL